MDAATLAELLRRGALPEVHVPGAEARQLRIELGVRRQLVRQRAALVNQVRGLLRGWGVLLPARFFAGGASWSQVEQRATLPVYVRGLLGTLAAVYRELTKAIREVEKTLRKKASQEELVVRLQTLPGVGPLSALTLVAAVDEIGRFAWAKQLTSYCGIVPTVRSSGEREQQGPITRQGHSEVRAVWVQAARALVRSRQPTAHPLQRWFVRVARRRGLRTALVALTRKLLSLAFYLLRDGTQYEPSRLRPAVA